MRYDRVQSILEHDPALKELLGPKDQEIKKRNGEKHFYSRGVVLVTNALHERNIDAHQAPQPIVLGLAHTVLKNAAANKPAPKPKAKRPEPKPSPAPAPAKPAPVPKPAPPSKVEIKVPAKPTRPVASVPVPASAPKKPDAKPQAPAKQEPVAVPPAPVPAVGEATKPAFVYYIYGNALSLAVSLAKMLEVGDRLPGAEQRQESVNKIIDQLIPLRDTAVPMPKDLMPVVTNAKTTAPKS